MSRIDSINAADPQNPTVKPVPYVGIQFVAIPEFAGIATEVSQEFSAAYAGQQSIDDALRELPKIVRGDTGLAMNVLHGGS